MINNKQADQKSYHDQQSKVRKNEINQSVLVEDKSGNSKWIPGIILSLVGPMNYEVLVNNKVFKRHVYQILKSTESVSSTVNHPEPTKTDNSINFPSSTDEYHPLPETDAPTDRYPSRDRRPPDRLKLELRTVVYGIHMCYCVTFVISDI